MFYKYGKVLCHFKTMVTHRRHLWVLCKVLPHICVNNMWAVTWENKQFAYAKTKMQISCAVTAQLISAFVFATRIVQFLFYIYPKFQASSFILWLYSLVCVGLCRKPKLLVFSCTGSCKTYTHWLQAPLQHGHKGKHHYSIPMFHLHETSHLKIW